jgi:hypothetical protein
LIRPTALDHDGKKGWMVIHECERCGKRIPNKAAPDDDLSQAPSQKH